MELLEPPRFALTELAKAKAFLEAEGYAVICDVYTPAECDRFCDQLTTSIEAICPAAVGVPLAELTAGHLPATDSNGLRGALTQSPAMWGIRQHAPTQKLHRYLQGWSAEEELVVSLDKAVLQVGRAPRLGSWLHVDTCDPKNSALQGTAYLRDAYTAQHASLVVVPGSHRRHAELLAAQKKPPTTDYVVWEDASSLAPVQLALHQGDHVVWYSHTTHQGGAGQRKRKRDEDPHLLRRVAAMVSYAKKSARPESVRAQKQAVAENGGCTTHWAAQCVKQPLTNRWPRKVGPTQTGVNHELNLPLRPELTPEMLALL
jgi:hypothetical protein